MYSWEIDNYLKDKNYHLSIREYTWLTLKENNPQIKRVKYDPFENNFSIWTEDNYFWIVRVYREKYEN